MAFNVGAYIKNTAKTALDIIKDGIVNQATVGLNKYTISSAKSTAESLIATGASYASTSAITAQKVDATASRSESAYYAMAGKDVSKTSAADLSKQRNQGSEDVNSLLQNVVPGTKIASKKANKAESVMAVL